MVIASERIIFVVIFLLVFGVLPFVLQVWLSKRESRYPGMVLPVLSLLFALVAVLGCVMYEYEKGDIFVLVIPFLLFNIPTVIHLTIYFACREKFSKKKQMDKLNVQDL
ncbi:MAG: hypothetical protein MJ077_09710 [Oscillospiraceae bacterium]|nr:hypothetical protein [Oscillospiraceae bacterium]